MQTLNGVTHYVRGLKELVKPPIGHTGDGVWKEESFSSCTIPSASSEILTHHPVSEHHQNAPGGYHSIWPTHLELPMLGSSPLHHSLSTAPQIMGKWEVCGLWNQRDWA